WLQRPNAAADLFAARGGVWAGESGVCARGLPPGRRRHAERAAQNPHALECMGRSFSDLSWMTYREIKKPKPTAAGADPASFLKKLSHQRATAESRADLVHHLFSLPAGLCDCL